MEGKDGQALSLVRAGSGRAPGPNFRLAELNRSVTLGTDLAAIDSVNLSKRNPDSGHELLLSGSMAPCHWTINGESFPNSDPMHVHGRTFALREDGAREDTVIVRPMQSVDVGLDANNPGTT